MVALATIRTNQKAAPRITNAQQTISHGQTTRVNTLPLIAFTAIHTHAQIQITQTTFSIPNSQWMLKQSKISKQNTTLPK